MRARSSLVVLLSALASPFVAATAWADAAPCVTDHDCAHGFTCQVVGGTNCASPACKPGDSCPAPPPCEAGVILGCVPGPCTSDVDCPTDMVCQASTSTTCSGVGIACSADAACPVPDPPTCTSETTHACVPRYLLPCQVDTDCAPAGFACQPQSSCACASSGGAGSASSSAGAPMPPDPASPPDTPQALDAGEAQPIFVDAGAPPPVDCSCHDAGTLSCVLQDIPCSTAADCPSGWSCAAEIAPPVCPALALADGATPDCAAPTSSSSCIPPYWNATLSTGHTPAESGGAPSGSSDGASTSPAAPTDGTAGGRSAPIGSAGGCSMATSLADAHPAGASWALVGLGAVLALATGRRRRAGHPTK